MLMICLRQTGVATEAQKHRKRKCRVSVTRCFCDNIPNSEPDIIHTISGVSVSKNCLGLLSKKQTI